jgi:hypothetical protein
MCAETERWCRSSSETPAAAKIIAWRPQGEMCAGSSLADYKSHSNPSLAGLPFMTSVQQADAAGDAVELTTALGTWPLERVPRRTACSPETARVAALYQEQYDEMDTFTQQLSSSSGMPVMKKWRCRPLRSKRALKLNAACSTLSWSATQCVQLCEVAAVERSRCTVTLQLVTGDASFVLPSKLAAELLESLLLTLCADRSSSSSISKRGSATCSAGGTISSSRKSIGSSNSSSKRSSCTAPF